MSKNKTACIAVADALKIAEKPKSRTRSELLAALTAITLHLYEVDQELLLTKDKLATAFDAVKKLKESHTATALATVSERPEFEELFDLQQRLDHVGSYLRELADCERSNSRDVTDKSEALFDAIGLLYQKAHNYLVRK